MLEWSAEQATEITHELIDMEFLPTATNVERGVPHLDLVLQQMHAALVALTSFDANVNVANSRKNLMKALRRLQKMRQPYDRMKKANFALHNHFSWTVLSPGTSSGDRTMGILRVAL